MVGGKNGGREEAAVFITQLGSLKPGAVLLSFRSESSTFPKEVNFPLILAAPYYY
jgi:hypothetical protein